jgi:CheY-like chemotaxis protein
MGKRRILIVDDDPLMLQMLEDGIALYFHDYQVVCETDGRAALKQLEQAPFDLLLTDYHMPGMNGLELAQVVRQAWPRIPVVLMTAHGSGEQLLATSQPLELSSYLQKPFSMVQMRDVLHGCMDRRS